MDLTALIIQLISGAIGGNAAGAVSKDTSLGHCRQLDCRRTGRWRRRTNSQLRSRGGRRRSSLRAGYRSHSVRVRHRWC